MEGQISFLKQAVLAPPEIFTFAHSGRQLVWSIFMTLQPLPCFACLHLADFNGCVTFVAGTNHSSACYSNRYSFKILQLMRYFCRLTLMDFMATNLNLDIQITHGCLLIFWIYCVNLLREVMLDLCNQFWSFPLKIGPSYCYLGWRILTYIISFHLCIELFFFKDNLFSPFLSRICIF